MHFNFIKKITLFLFFVGLQTYSQNESATYTITEQPVDTLAIQTQKEIISVNDTIQYTPDQTTYIQETYQEVYSDDDLKLIDSCLLYTSPSPRDA